MAQGQTHNREGDCYPAGACTQSTEEELVRLQPVQVGIDGDSRNPDLEVFVFGVDGEAEKEDAVDGEPDDGGADQLVGPDGGNEEAGVDDQEDPVD